MKSIARAVAAFLVGAGAAARGAEPPRRAAPFPAGSRWVALGDSITRGGLYHSDVLLYYATRFPDRRLELHNAGISGDTATGAVSRLGWDVLSHRPTVVTIMLGTNDVGSRLYSVAAPDPQNLSDRQAHIDAHDRAMRQLVDTLTKAGVQVTVIVSPMLDETELLDKPGNPAVDDALAVLAAHDRGLAAERGVGLVDLRALMVPITRANQKNNPAFTLLGPDRTHPGPIGHLVMAYAVLKAQGQSALVSKMVVDAAARTVVEQDNAEVSAVESEAAGLRFTVLEHALPFPVDALARPALQLVPFTRDFNQEILVVARLRAGRYTLRIDGRPVGDYAAGEFAAGLNLAENGRTPQAEQARQVAVLNRQRHDLGANRTLAYLRRFVLEPAGVDATDPGATRIFLEKYLQSNALPPEDHGSFAAAMARAYLAGKAESPDSLRRQDELLAEIYTVNQPQPHHYEVVPVVADLAARAAAFSRRNAPENIDRTAANFLALLMSRDEQAQAELGSRPDLAAVSRLIAQGRSADALGAFRAYFFAKLTHPERFGLPCDLIQARGETDLAAADALLAGKLRVDRLWLDIGEPGGVTPERLVGSGPLPDSDRNLTYGLPDRWTPEIFAPLARAFVATKDRRYLDRWVAYLDDWAMNDSYADQFDPNAIPDHASNGAASAVEILRTLAGVATALPAGGEGFPAASLARILGRTITAYPALSWAYHRANSENWSNHVCSDFVLLGLMLDEFRVGPMFLRFGQRRLEIYDTAQNLPDGTETEHAHWYNAAYAQGGTREILEMARARPAPPFAAGAVWTDSIHSLDWQRRIADSVKLRGGYIVREVTPLGRLPIGVRNDLRKLKSGSAWHLAELYNNPAIVDDPVNARLISTLYGDGALGAPGFTSEGFPWGGYYNLRSGWTPDAEYADLFCSSVPTAGHGLIGMKNNNAVGLGAFGAELLVTGAFGSYSYQRSPVRVDGQEEFFHAGIANPTFGMGHRGFMTSFEPQAPAPFRWLSSPQFDLAEGIYRGPYGFVWDDHHDNKNTGLDALAAAAGTTINDVTHQRVLQFVKPLGLWIMTDRLSSGSRHEFSQDLRLPLAPALRPELAVFARGEIAVDAAAGTIRTAKSGSPNVSISHFGPAGAGGAPPEVRYDATVEDGAWLKHDYTYRYKLSDILRVSAHWRGRGAQQLVSLIYPRRAGAPELTKVQPLAAADGRILGFAATTPEGTRVSYLADPNARGRLQIGAIAIIGESLLVTQAPDGTVRGMALDARDASLDGRPVDAAGDFEFIVRDGGLRVVEPILRPILPVIIQPERNAFIGSQAIALSCPTPGVEIHYTLDGGEVTPASPEYLGPFVIQGSLLVKVRAFRAGLTSAPLTESGTEASARQEARFQKIAVLAAAPPRPTAPGLQAERFEGNWRDLVFFRDGLVPVSRGTAPHLFAPGHDDSGQVFASVLRGFIDVPADGLYTFEAPRESMLPSIDSGYSLELWVGSSPSHPPVLNLWYPATSRHAFGTWTVALGKGLQPFQLVYVDFRGRDVDRLNHPALRENYLWAGEHPVVLVSGPGIAKQPLPENWLRSPRDAASSAPSFPGEASQWHGYDIRRFALPSGNVATVVLPSTVPAPGRPWILQCSLYGDGPVTGRVNGPALALLAKGWHVAVLDLGNTFGAPSALKKWNELYAMMTGTYGLSRRPILVGLSREGLTIQRWAAAHPGQVGGIYGDRPVCDFKSWPGGKVGVGQGSPRDWASLIRLYGFASEGEALAYRENPVDLAGKIGEARIPVLYVIGDADVVVPYADNAAIMVARIRAAGGKVTVINQPGVGHHPHGLEDPAPAVEFMLRCAQSAPIL